MKTILKIPNSIDDMTLDHLPFFLALIKLFNTDKDIDENVIKDMDPIQVSDLNALFFGEQPEWFDKYTDKGNKDILSEILLSCSRRIERPIKLSYEINGTKYVFVSDYSKQPVSFLRDIKKCINDQNEFDDPLDMLAFCYVEEGMSYNQLDKHNNIINPRTERAKAFDGVISLSEHMDLHAFFFDSWNAFQPYLKVREIARKKVSGIGKNQ